MTMTFKPGDRAVTHFKPGDTAYAKNPVTGKWNMGIIRQFRGYTNEYCDNPRCHNVIMQGDLYCYNFLHYSCIDCCHRGPK